MEKLQLKEAPMKCGQYEAVQPVYKKLIGKSGDIWLVPIGKFAADNVHVSGGPNSRGYAGATLKFKLEDGSTLELTGPWHCNASALFADTGYDIRDKHSTKVVLALKAEHKPGKWLPELSEILHKDEEPQEGIFDRGTDMAKEYANRLNKPVYYHVETGGGSHSGWMDPGEK